MLQSPSLSDSVCSSRMTGGLWKSQTFHYSYCQTKKNGKILWKQLSRQFVWFETVVYLQDNSSALDGLQRKSRREVTLGHIPFFFALLCKGLFTPIRITVLIAIKVSKQMCNILFIKSVLISHLPLQLCKVFKYVWVLSSFTS